MQTPNNPVLAQDIAARLTATRSAQPELTADDLTAGVGEHHGNQPADDNTVLDLGDSLIDPAAIDAPEQVNVPELTEGERMYSTTAVEQLPGSDLTAIRFDELHRAGALRRRFELVLEESDPLVIPAGLEHRVKENDPMAAKRDTEGKLRARGLGFAIVKGIVDEVKKVADLPVLVLSDDFDKAGERYLAVIRARVANFLHLFATNLEQAGGSRAEVRDLLDRMLTVNVLYETAPGLLTINDATGSEAGLSENINVVVRVTVRTPVFRPDADLVNVLSHWNCIVSLMEVAATSFDEAKLSVKIPDNLLADAAFKQYDDDAYFGITTRALYVVSGEVENGNEPDNPFRIPASPSIKVQRGEHAHEVTYLFLPPL